MLLVLVAACSGGTEASQPAAKTAEPIAATAKGTVETRTFHSEALGVDKDYVVYVPAGYADKPTAKWPVFYYLHGLTGDEKSWIKGGHLDQAADRLGLGAILVMPDGDDGFYADSPRAIDYDACMRDGTGLFLRQMQSRPKTCVRHHAYETYITKDLVGDVDAAYRTLARRDARAIAGLSMGGFGALQLAMRHPDLFVAAASHSGVDALLYGGPHPYVAGKVVQSDVRSWGAGAAEIGAWVRAIFGSDLATWQAYDPAALIAKLAPGQLALYLDCGTEDGFALNDGASYLHDLLVARHYDHAFFLGPGGHDFNFWIARLPESLKFLRAHVAKPS
jgi:putative tributyrin esterase